MKKMALAVLFGLCFGSVVYSGPAIAAEPRDRDQEFLVERAQITLSQFQSDQDMQWFRQALKNAKGVLIFPKVYKAGLGIGGSGGKGVLLVKDAKTGEWNGPAFYNLGSFTLGIQAGAEVSQVVILAMTDKAVYDLLSSRFKLDSDASAAAGTTGIGISGNSSLPVKDFLTFSRSKGFYGGLNLRGSMIKADTEADAAYYGKNISTEAIFRTGDIMAPKAAALRKEMARVESAAESSSD